VTDDGRLYDGPGASLPSVPSDPAQNVEYLRSLLGDPFVDWVLADPTETLTQAQLEIAADLAGILCREISRYPELPVDHAASLLAFYHKPAGTTILNYARQYVGGAAHEVDQDPDDRLLSSFHAFASECYGEMLLPGSTFGDRRPDFHQYARTQAGRDLTRAIIDEGIKESSHRDRRSITQVLMAILPNCIAVIFRAALRRALSTTRGEWLSFKTETPRLLN
jgi:hypothetical protein